MKIPADASMGYIMNVAARLFRRLADRRLEPLGLSSGYLPVLAALVEHEALSQKALLERVGIEQPTMAATLARMERDAVIERRPDPHDKRSALFSLTSATREKTRLLQATIDRMSADALADIPEQHHQEYRSMLQTMIATLERQLS